jgi:DNA-binding CsgD family transcriptional regulator
MPAPEIATKLFVSSTTVRSHLENAFAKLGAHTRTEAVAHLARLVPIPVRSESQPERPATLSAHRP